MKIAAIIFSLLALAGAAFSGYAYMATQTKMQTLAVGVGQAMELQQATESFDWSTPQPFVTAVTSKYKEIEKQRKDAEDDARVTKTQLRNARDELADATEAREKLQEQVKDTRRKLSVAQDKVSNQETEISTQEQRITKLENDIRDYESKKSDITPEEYQAVIASAESLQETIDAQKETMAELSKEIEDLKNAGQQGDNVEFRVLAENTPILEIAPEVGLIVLGAGTNLGDTYAPNTRVTLRKDGRRLARLQIISVQGSKSVANILPGYGYPEMLSAQDSVEVLQ